MQWWLGLRQRRCFSNRSFQVDRNEINRDTACHFTRSRHTIHPSFARATTINTQHRRPLTDFLQNSLCVFCSIFATFFRNFANFDKTNTAEVASRTWWNSAGLRRQNVNEIQQCTGRLSAAELRKTGLQTLGILPAVHRSDTPDRQHLTPWQWPQICPRSPSTSSPRRRSATFLY